MARVESIHVRVYTCNVARVEKKYNVTEKVTELRVRFVHRAG